MPTSLRARRLALFTLFFLPGFGIASWVTRTPDVRDLLGASTAQMGLILFGLSVGSMIGILLSGPLVARLGTRTVIAAGSAITLAGVATIGAGALATSPAVVTVGLGLVGLGIGGGEVAMNVDGAEVERLTGRSVMPMLHGFFSFGTVIGAVIGMLLTAWRVPVGWHLLGAACLMLAALVVAIRYVPAGFGRSHPAEAGRPRERAGVWRDPNLLLTGGIILALALAEGTANDWLPLVMVDGHGYDAAWGSAIFALFALSMTIGRFAGGRFVDRYGRAAVLAASAIFGAAGLAIVVFVDQPVVAGAAVVLWGVGTSLGFPVAISAAGDSGPHPAARVSFAATLGYVAFLVGPPVLGALGEHIGLRGALVPVLTIVAIAVFLTPAARTTRAAQDA
ncbi:MFS transporter [Microbacterium sp. ZXX196]|uniref:MFS transporter n=1 Tax=Microbacterium sp. ZXX196 TaxID=2609291 RepID=UPI0012B6D411|nr:MFS transporter [Microbacterium sp. ZXX196]MTE24935.1 MFS transporter [Microbacterium sp. ZXX196]